MSLAVTGIGMVSPAGLSPADHVFFVRAGAVTPPSSPFSTGDDKRVEVWFCPWIGARAPVASRLVQMAETAIGEALAPVERDLGQGGVAALVVASRPRAGLSASEREQIVSWVCRRVRASTVASHAGEAGAFAALESARELLEKGEVRAAVVVALDSFVSAEALTEHVRRPPSYWSDDVPAPSEGAAAIVLMRRADAQRAAEVIGRTHGAAIEAGTSTDEDDEIVDGAAMTSVLRRLPNKGTIGLVVGQAHTDELRRREWHIATARTARRFAEQHEVHTLERETGRLGAASGAMSLAYGLALARHQGLADEAARRSPFVAWAISRDGTRGAALVTGGAG